MGLKRLLLHRLSVDDACSGFCCVLANGFWLAINLGDTLGLLLSGMKVN